MDVPATVEEVWKAWTTSEGATTFFAPHAHIEAEVGGAYELYFDTESPEGARGSEGCVVHSLLPPSFLAFSWNAPPHLPRVRDLRTLVTLRFGSTSEGTRLEMQHSGWGVEADWREARTYFESAWTVVMDRLVQRFEKGPMDWNQS
jgi:uncharacterized protein YndB with AHSA1/START domain